MLTRWRSYVRANHWWGFKAAPILGFMYLYCYFFDFPFSDQLIILALSAITIIGIAGFGYVINDIYDLEADKEVGKNNPLEGKSTFFIFGVLSILSILALLPWLVLKSNIYIQLAIGFQMVLYLLYAHPLFRLKEKSIWGPICDALYGHAVPIIIACLTYQQYLGGQLPYIEWWFFLSLFIWQFFKGLRNILLHQLEDYECDIQAGIKTLTSIKGKDVIYQKILFFILPVEVLTLFAFISSLSAFSPWLYLFFFVFILINIFGHGIFRNIVWHPKVYSQNTYIYFLNNFYETYLPYFFLSWCILHESTAFFLLIIHVILFPSTLNMLQTDFKKTTKEIWIQIDNLAARVKNKLKNNDI